MVLVAVLAAGHPQTATPLLLRRVGRVGLAVTAAPASPGQPAPEQPWRETMAPLSSLDKHVIEDRQLRHRASDAVAVPACTRCKHGFPQAALYKPIGVNKPISGITRLTCPWLVKAIDEFEGDGAINRFNARLQADSNWQSNLRATNQAHRMIRRDLMTDEEVESLHEIFGDVGATAFLHSGIAGMSPTKLDDVKCLHAQVSDYLLRGGSNTIGEAVLDQLEQLGVDPAGSSFCREQCDVASPETTDTWRYVPAKNKQGLRQRRNRRRADQARVHEQRKEAAARFGFFEVTPWPDARPTKVYAAVRPGAQHVNTSNVDESKVEMKWAVDEWVAFVAKNHISHVLSVAEERASDDCAADRQLDLAVRTAGLHHTRVCLADTGAMDALLAVLAAAKERHGVVVHDSTANSSAAVGLVLASWLSRSSLGGRVDDAASRVAQLAMEGGPAHTALEVPPARLAAFLDRGSL